MKNRRASIFTILIVVMLCVYAAITLVRLNTKINGAQADQDELREQVSAMEIENDEMRNAIATKDSDETKRDIALKDLNLVDPDDRVFYDSGN